MNVIWKRPDGFHGATPDDFRVLRLGNHSNLWLHKTDKDQFPFRVSGGWEEQIATKRLNNLINLIGKESRQWVEYLSDELFIADKKNKPSKFFEELYYWVDELKKVLKGDKWEIEIMHEALDHVLAELKKCKNEFIKDTDT